MATARDIDVICVGSCNMDLISYVPRFPQLGETLHGSSFSTGFGGKGANQAVAAARLGARTCMVAKVGTDSFGADTISNFSRLGMDVTHVSTTSEASTGVAPIFVDKAGNNCIVIVSGANMLLSSKEVDAATAAMQRSRVLVCQLEIDASTTLYAMRAAKAAGVFVVLNPAPAERDLPDELLREADVVCPNETEAQLLARMDSVNGPAQAEEAARAIRARGARSVVVTMGGSGCLVLPAGDDEAPVHVPAPQVAEVVDTVGAGDCFVGVMALALARHASLVDAARFGVEAASVSVGKRGTQTSFPDAAALGEGSRATLERLLATE